MRYDVFKCKFFSPAERWRAFPLHLLFPDPFRGKTDQVSAGVFSNWCTSHKAEPCSTMECSNSTSTPSETYSQPILRHLPFRKGSIYCESPQCPLEHSRILRCSWHIIRRQETHHGGQLHAHEETGRNEHCHG